MHAPSPPCSHRRPAIEILAFLLLTCGSSVHPAIITSHTLTHTDTHGRTPRAPCLQSPLSTLHSPLSTPNNPAAAVSTDNRVADRDGIADRVNRRPDGSAWLRPRSGVARQHRLRVRHRRGSTKHACIDRVGDHGLVVPHLRHRDVRASRRAVQERQPGLPAVWVRRNLPANPVQPQPGTHKLPPPPGAGAMSTRTAACMQQAATPAATPAALRAGIVTQDTAARRANTAATARMR